MNSLQSLISLVQHTVPTLGRRAFYGLLVVLLCAPVLDAFAQAAPAADGIVIQYKGQLRRTGEGQSLQLEPGHRQLIRPTGSVSAAGMQRQLNTLRQDPNVEFAEPNYIGYFQDMRSNVDVGYFSANASLVAQQWWLQDIAGNTLRSIGFGNDVTVAVIDSGVDFSHPNLAPNLLANGYNFGDDNAFPIDLRGHGTAISGIIAATSNSSSYGIDGLAPGVKILPIKVNLRDENVYNAFNIARGIDHAIANKANIINLSLGFAIPNLTVQTAIQRALDKGIVVVAAAGNDGGAVNFPGSMPGVIGVAATNQSRTLAIFSSRGPEVAIAAPGVDIFTTDLGGRFTARSGTSFSSPIVVAAIADLMSVNRGLTPQGLLNQIRATAGLIPGVSNYGLLNAGAAGEKLLPYLKPSSSRYNRSQSVELQYEMPQTGGPVNVYVSAQTPAGSYTLLPNGTWQPVPASGSLPVAANYRSDAPVAGVLFGAKGLFASVPMAGLPIGSYKLSSALASAVTGKPVGITTEVAFTLE